MVLTPFVTSDEMVLLLHIVGIFSILLHWKSNNDVCCLTTAEAYYRGISYRESFLHQYIGPIYNYQETQTNSFSYVVTLGLLIFSLHNFFEMDGYTRAKRKIYIGLQRLFN